jgi:hypothetical protein
MLGLFWAFCLRARSKIRRRSGLMYRIFAVISPWLFVACLPPLVRAGPEAYKGLVLEGVLIPVGTLLFACRPKKSRRRTVPWPRLQRPVEALP